MIILKNTNGKIKGFRLNTDNSISIFLTDGDVKYINKISNEESLFSEIRKIDENVDENFIKKIYEVINGAKK